MADALDSTLSKIVNDLGELVAAKSKEAIHDAEQLVEDDVAQIVDQLKQELQRGMQRGKDRETRSK